MSVGGADLGAESASELDLVVDAHLMAYQVALGEIAFAARRASVVANVPMNQINVVLRHKIEEDINFLFINGKSSGQYATTTTVPLPF